MLSGTQELVGRVLQTQNGFGDIKLAAQEVIKSNSLDGSVRLANELLDADTLRRGFEGLVDNKVKNLVRQH